MYSNADCFADINGNFGFKHPTAVAAFLIANSRVCSMYPSMGRPETGSGSRFGGSLFGNFKFEYFSGSLKKQIISDILKCENLM